MCVEAATNFPVLAKSKGNGTARAVNVDGGAASHREVVFVVGMGGKDLHDGNNDRRGQLVGSVLQELPFESGWVCQRLRQNSTAANQKVD